MSDEVPTVEPVVETVSVDELKRKIDELTEKFEESTRTIEDLRRMNQTLANMNAALSRLVPVGNTNLGPAYTVPSYDDLEKLTVKERYELCHKYAQDCIDGRA